MNRSPHRITDLGLYLGFAVAGLLVGCQPPPGQQQDKPAWSIFGPPRPPVKPVPAPSPAAPAPSPGDVASAGTPTALAQRAESYARSMEPLMSKRGSPTTAPSIVQWVDPDALRLSVAPPGSAPILPTPPAPVKTPDVSQGTANQTASLAPATAAAAPDGAVAPPRPDSTPRLLAPATPAADELHQRIAQRVKDYPQDVVAQLDYQLLQYIDGETTPQIQALTPLQIEDRELLCALMDGLGNFRNGIRADSNMLLSRKVRPLLDMADRLRSQAELSIPVVALCRRVDGYGIYEPIEPLRFTAGRESPAIVYCEVENFASQLDSQKRWETKLGQDVVLYDEQGGMEVWRDKTTHMIIDHSRNRRHDFFVVKMIRLPANLTIGRYLLKVSILDQEVNRVAENTLPIEIVAQ